MVYLHPTTRTHLMSFYVQYVADAEARVDTDAPYASVSQRQGLNKSFFYVGAPYGIYFITRSNLPRISLNCLTASISPEQ